MENVRTPSRPPESHSRDSLKWLTRNVSLRILRHLSTIVWGFLSFLIFPATKTWNGKSSVIRLCYEAVILLPCWGWVGYESVWNKKRVQKKTSQKIFLMASWRGRYLDKGGEIRSLALAPVLRHQWPFLKWPLSDSFSSLSQRQEERRPLPTLMTHTDFGLP